MFTLQPGFQEGCRRRSQLTFPHSSSCKLWSDWFFYCLLNTLFVFFLVEVTEASLNLPKQNIGIYWGGLYGIHRNSEQPGLKRGDSGQPTWACVEDHLPSSSLPSLGLRFYLSVSGNLRSYEQKLDRENLTGPAWVMGLLWSSHLWPWIRSHEIQIWFLRSCPYVSGADNWEDQTSKQPLKGVFSVVFIYFTFPLHTFHVPLQNHCYPFRLTSEEDLPDSPNQTIPTPLNSYFFSYNFYWDIAHIP